MFLKTVAEAEAVGAIAEIYAREKAEVGLVMAGTQCWTTRPDLLPIWQHFFDKVKEGFSLSGRDWRLITLIAAKHVPSTYCSYVYGKLLIEDLGSKEAVLAVHRDFRSAGLSDRDVAMLAYAEAVVTRASTIGDDDIEGLRAVRFSDVEISDIALCASLRCFLSRFVDATGARPEDMFIDSDDTFRAALTVGWTP